MTASKRALLALLALAVVAWAVCRPAPLATPSALLKEYEDRGWDSYELEGDLAMERRQHLGLSD